MSRSKSKPAEWPSPPPPDPLITSRSTSSTSSINGKWQKPKSGKYFDTINPANEKVLARIAEAGDAIARTRGTVADIASMIKALLQPLRSALFFLSVLATMAAQAQGGGCSITLLSADSTDEQAFCADPVNVTIDPVVYMIEGTGLQVTGLPPGVVSTFANDTLTLTGTITTTGVWYPDITLNEGCSADLYFSVSQSVDPGFSCTVVGDSIVVSWPGLDAPTQQDGTMFLFWTDGVDLLGQTVYFLPCPGSLTVGGLPANTPITFSMSLVSGMPNCLEQGDATACTIISTGIGDPGADEFLVRAVPRGDVLELSSSVALHDLRIYDMLGGLVLSHRMNARIANVPIGCVAPGAYVLRVVDADGRVSAQRFVKE